MQASTSSPLSRHRHSHQPSPGRHFPTNHHSQPSLSSPVHATNAHSIPLSRQRHRQPCDMYSSQVTPAAADDGSLRYSSQVSPADGSMYSSQVTPAVAHDGTVGRLLQLMVQCTVLQQLLSTICKAMVIILNLLHQYQTRTTMTELQRRHTQTPLYHRPRHPAVIKYVIFYE